MNAKEKGFSKICILMPFALSISWCLIDAYLLFQVDKASTKLIVNCTVSHQKSSLEIMKTI